MHFFNCCYSGIVHPSREYPACHVLDTVIEHLKEELPESLAFSKDSWNCLVTLYEDANSFIPPHSDDEKSIEPNSDIITVSLGSTRTLIFQNIVGPLTDQQHIELNHGSSVTQLSQSSWQHSIPPSLDRSCGPRISLTFRRLRNIDKHTIPPIVPPDAKSSTNTNLLRPKRLLILSDSIHTSFPTHWFDPKAIVCIKKRLPNLCLGDISLYENEFPYTDYVFISCGVNDLSRYGRNSYELSKYFIELMNVYSTKYQKTQFIFNSVLLTNFAWLNQEISQLNDSIFRITCRKDSNVWFFDSHHIAHIMSRCGAHVLETKTRHVNCVHITYAVIDWEP